MSGKYLEAQSLDRKDPLSARVDGYAVGPFIQLNGNSLGPPRNGVLHDLERAVHEQWSRRHVQAWFADGWLELPRVIGDRIGSLLGARSGQVVVPGDTTSTTLFNAVMAACGLRPERSVLLVEAESFPTDLYIAASVARLTNRRFVTVTARGLDAALEEYGTEVATIVVSPVDFRTGELRAIGAITERCHAVGAIAVWDLSHAAGVLPIEVDENQVDLAVGCGYKYLGGGPGAPAYLYVADRLQQTVEFPLAGWHGHAAPFEMSARFDPARGIDRGRTGTPPVLSLVALNHALDPLVQAGPEDLWRRSRSLSEFFLACLEERPELASLLVSPRDPDRRGGHLALRIPGAERVESALAHRGVLVDSREPDLIRVAFAPLYVTHSQVWQAAQALDKVVKEMR